MKWLIPLAACLLGLFVFCAGLGYDVIFAGIPYQGPTPELRARYAFHSGVALSLELAGLGAFGLGLLGLLTVALYRWLAPPPGPSRPGRGDSR
jgi:hypothetical protein